ncbi:MAG TPA: PEP-CTERM sorting domain-containing protein [Methylomirabilota bacterium]|nr:PEP-CTERM sorting domain-containing protein [Methylomirabilota bacterium]
MIPNTRLITLAALNLFAFPSAAEDAGALAATSGYFEGWDASGDLAGWSASSSLSSVTQVDTGGNPGGFLWSRVSDGSTGGVSTGLPAATGDFTGTPWTVSFDLFLFSGGFSDIWLRFRYHDATFNGWRFGFAPPPTNAWTSFSVTFDPSWTDAQARAAGWTTDSPDGFRSVSFSQTLADVYSTELRFAGPGRMVAGLDNFSLEVVPEPSTVGLALVGAIGVLLGMRRRSGAARATVPKAVSVRP